jgi:hypothetical protein
MLEPSNRAYQRDALGTRLLLPHLLSSTGSRVFQILLCGLLRPWDCLLLDLQN